MFLENGQFSKTGTRRRWSGNLGSPPNLGLLFGYFGTGFRNKETVLQKAVPQENAKETLGATLNQRGEARATLQWKTRTAIQFDHRCVLHGKQKIAKQIDRLSNQLNQQSPNQTTNNRPRNPTNQQIHEQATNKAPDRPINQQIHQPTNPPTNQQASRFRAHSSNCLRSRQLFLRSPTFEHEPRVCSMRPHRSPQPSPHPI